MGLEKTKNLVLMTLKEFPITRDNDELLYLYVCKKVNPIFLTLPFGEAMVRRKDLKLPSYKSVCRTRRKVQEENKELKASTKVQIQREEAEQSYKKFAKQC